VDADEERIALFLDFENLAIGARESLHGATFDLRPVLDALAERGRVVSRKAYADWSFFDEDRRMLTRSLVELIEIPQRMGAVRKNAADIKLAVDALELAFEREYVTTFVICTGDSDFTPLVNKLRELNKRVIGVGIKGSTSALLPPACDEFLFYETLEGVDVPEPSRRRRQRDPDGDVRSAGRAGTETGAGDPEVGEADPAGPRNADELAVLIARTVAGLEQTTGGAVLASNVKRALLRKDPTFSETDHGFRAFGELLRHLADRNVIELAEGPARGDPLVSLPQRGGETEGFDLLRKVVADLGSGDGEVYLSGLKTQLRRVQPDFSEKRYGYRGFLQFCRAAEANGVVSLGWDEDAGDYVLGAA